MERRAKRAAYGFPGPARHHPIARGSSQATDRPEGFHLPPIDIAGLLADGYNAWAPAYDRDMAAMGYALPDIFADVVARHLPDAGSRILDAGTGTGILGQRLGRRGYRHLVGIDTASGMLDMARRKNVYRSLRWMALDDPLEFADHSFDGVAAMGVFNWAQAPLPALEEFVRLTRPGGRVVFSATLDDRGRSCCRTARRRITRAGRWHRLETVPAFASHPGASPHARVRVFAYGIP